MKRAKIGTLPKSPAPRPVPLFYSYAYADKSLQAQLEEHLSLLRRQRLLETWHDQAILAEKKRLKEMRKYSCTTFLILLLISSSFLASDHCYNIEMQNALNLQQYGLAHVVPILLRPCDWQQAPFAKLQALPYNGCPITIWNNLDEAFTEVVQRLRLIVEKQVNLLDRNGQTI